MNASNTNSAFPIKLTYRIFKHLNRIANHCAVVTIYHHMPKANIAFVRMNCILPEFVKHLRFCKFIGYSKQFIDDIALRYSRLIVHVFGYSEVDMLPECCNVSIDKVQIFKSRSHKLFYVFF